MPHGGGYGKNPLFAVHLEESRVSQIKKHAFATFVVERNENVFSHEAEGDDHNGESHLPS